VGPPHLALGHPAGVVTDLPKKLRGLPRGTDLVLSPIVSVGNPGNDSAFVELATNPELVTRFVQDALGLLKAHDLDGLNFDMEFSEPASPSRAAALQAFLETLHEKLDSEGFAVTWDGGNLKPSGVTAPIESYVTMSSYGGTVADFAKNVEMAVADVNDRVGVGLCPSCQNDDRDVVEGRFAVLRETPRARQVWVWSLWGRGAGAGWDFYWPALAAWLRAP
jgi:hypothetical protein